MGENGRSQKQLGAVVPAHITDPDLIGLVVIRVMIVFLKKIFYRKMEVV